MTTRVGGVPPTRSNLLKARHRAERVAKGIDLLTRKRRALVGELFRVAAPAVQARERVLARASTAYPAVLQALASGGTALQTAGWPLRALEVEVEGIETWGVRAGRIHRRVRARRTLSTRGQAPPFMGLATAQAANEFEDLVELLLDAASTELLLRRLADALARTSRQVNTLERRVRPVLQAQVRWIRGALEEREREDHVRLRRFVKTRS